VEEETERGGEGRGDKEVWSGGENRVDEVAERREEKSRGEKRIGEMSRKEKKWK
jgi:hypothetical protein